MDYNTFSPDGNINDAEDTRKSYRTKYIVLTVLYGLLAILTWVCFGLTLNFLDGSSGYHGALAGMGGPMISEFFQCLMIASKVMIAKYDPENNCGFYATVRWQPLYPMGQLVSSLIVIIFATLYGIRYEDLVAMDKQVNVDKNFAMGIANVVVGSLVFLTSLMAMYFGVALKTEVEQGRRKEGPFAVRDESYKM